MHPRTLHIAGNIQNKGLIRKEQHDYNYITSGFVETLKHFLSRTCKDQIPGFSRTQKSFLKDFPRYVPFTDIGYMRSKSAHTESLYQHFSKQAQMPLLACAMWSLHMQKMLEYVAMYYTEIIMYLAIT